jgi:SAM-dependent methyltransferase
VTYLTPAVATAQEGPAAPDFDVFPDLFDRVSGLWDGIDRTLCAWLDTQVPNQPTGRALDLGAGAGRHSLLLADRHHQVLAIDVADRLLSIGRQSRARANLVYARRDALSVTGERDGLFDTVLAVNSMHYLGDPGYVLGHVRSLLAPGGTLIVVDYVNPGSWTNPDYHLARAFGYTREAYRHTGDRHAAADTLRLLLHPGWLAAVAAYTPLSRDYFHHYYRAVFPGAVIIDSLHWESAAVVWQCPHPQPDHLPR